MSQGKWVFRLNFFQLHLWLLLWCRRSFKIVKLPAPSASFGHSVSKSKSCILLHGGLSIMFGPVLELQGMRKILFGSLMGGLGSARTTFASRYSDPEEKALEKKELDCQYDHTAKKSDLEAKIIHLEEKISNNCDSKSLHDDLDHCISISLEKLHLAKKDLAARLRMVLSVKQQLEDVPSQSELIQKFIDKHVNTMQHIMHFWSLKS